MHHPAHPVLPILLAFVFILYPGDGRAQASQEPDSIHRINGSIDFHQSDPPGTELKTVNGGVKVQSGSKAGAISTVNGPIRVAGPASLQAAQTVNGTITIGANASVEGTVQAVNGGITLESGSEVQGNVATVNGLIRLEGASVNGSIKTVNGNVLIRERSTIGGDVTFSEAGVESGWLHRLFGFGNGSQRSRLDIGADVVIGGDIHLYREVDLHIDDSAITGDIIRHY
ncbi:MAG: hypothetical protein WEB57_06665 [Pseudohongiellaceae bacterium]